MAMQRSGNAGILRPEEVGPLVVQPVQRASVAIQVSTGVTTESKDFRLPVVTDDVTAAWTAEGADINVSDADTDELLVTPKKLASLTKVSNELAADSTPEATEVVGQSISRDIARKIDVAYFGNTISNGPSGLLSLGDVQVVGPVGSIVDVDQFSEALSLAENVGSEITSWCANATTVLMLSKIKKLSGSNEPLLQPDPTLPTRRQILGIPPYSLPDTVIGDGVIWGIPKAKTFVVMRKNVEVVIDSSFYLNSDSLAVRSTMRVGFGFPHEEAIVKIEFGGS